MARVIRDYLDPAQIGQVVEIAVWRDSDTLTDYGAGRLTAYTHSKSIYTVFFEGAGVAMYWQDNYEYTVSYDPERTR